MSKPIETCRVGTQGYRNIHLGCVDLVLSGKLLLSQEQQPVEGNIQYGIRTRAILCLLVPRIGTSGLDPHQMAVSIHKIYSEDETALKRYPVYGIFS